MDAELKAKWVKALRSGKYRQTRDTYVEGGAYCCLGVAACVIAGQRIKSYWTCDKQQKALGINYGQSMRLIKMNDSGMTFKEIADYIERHL